MLKDLTFRKLEYLALASMGFTNKEIAQILSVSPVTTKATLAEIYGYLNAIDRTHAAFIATIKAFITIDLCKEILSEYPLASEFLHTKKLQRELKNSGNV